MKVIYALIPDYPPFMQMQNADIIEEYCKKIFFEYINKNEISLFKIKINLMQIFLEMFEQFVL